MQLFKPVATCHIIFTLAPWTEKALNQTHTETFKNRANAPNTYPSMFSYKLIHALLARVDTWGKFPALDVDVELVNAVLSTNEPWRCVSKLVQ